MDNMIIEGKSIKTWKEEHPILHDLVATKEVFWTNNNYTPFQEGMKNIPLTKDDVRDAEARLERFAPYIAKVFPETAENNGMIESPLVEIPAMKKHLEAIEECDLPGNILLKCDSHLPISGSIKARGGIYEVLKHAEDLALENGLLKITDNYSILDQNDVRAFFATYSIAVGSTGNLGLSIGIMSAKLGFKVTVHMSADAKQWKKDLLRSKGVIVKEYEADYGKAVEEGRKEADADSRCYFIDDENSKHLFLGYSVAASRLQKQLHNMNIVVDENHPLFVYLPCGVGGGPGGVAFGLKLAFQDDVNCFFAEPTHSPCMLLGLETNLHDKISVQDLGIDNLTAADGLAVGRPSAFVGKTIGPLLSGIYTISDERMHTLLSSLTDTEMIQLEPSALAGAYGPVHLATHENGKKYVADNNLEDKMKNGTHIIWATGGSMVPTDVMNDYYELGKELSK